MRSEAIYMNQSLSAYVRGKDIFLNNNSFENISLCSSSTGFAMTGETFMNTFTPITQTTVTSTENFMNNLSTYTASSLEKSAMPRRGVPFNAEALQGFDNILANATSVKINETTIAVHYQFTSYNGKVSNFTVIGQSTSNPNEYNAISASGTINGNTVTGISPYNPANKNDNKLFLNLNGTQPGANFVSSGGLNIADSTRIALSLIHI